ncbi:O-succinylbenzoate synthase [Candidatus Koribacter versatilis Ellin345]|uniref:o-succinylbenzoate synthase n=1 Tax=Koribacter versatilis (strain Ellin345) TaxID=204669 RepID=Q1IPL2_KORVE|nr:o-succinylbenzoate synthase [Candidatus Koribacter versatilis]ABF41188.1 O-succinylbenzoate synthase [Candidatus Koribacter versatilis Ellin345]
MKIEAITLREIEMPLVNFFETSFGRIYSRRMLLVTMHCDGVDGWGECVADEAPFYSPESVDTAWLIIRMYLAPMLLGKEVERGADVQPLLARVRGHRMAKGVLENAMWDAEAKAKNLPIWKLLGGSREKIPCGVSIGIQDSHEQLLDKIETELAAGYQRIKVKVKPGWDVEVLEKIRKRWPDILLSCDANSAYTLSDFEHLKEFEQFKLLMIEQPLWNDDFYFHAALQKQLKTALCLDEAIESWRDAQAALELGACRIVNIKVGRVGGFSEAIAVHDIAQRFGVPVWCGGMLECGLGRSHNIALSTLPNFSLPGDVSASKRYWKEDVIEPEVTVSPDGFIPIRDVPGTGYTLREDQIERITTKKETVRA